MDKHLTIKNIDLRFAKQINTENYQDRKLKIDGVKIIKLNQHISDDGYFIEIARLQKKSTLQLIPQFSISQISYSATKPSAIKAWHLHFKQDDLWFIPPGNKILIGLADVRQKSPTKGNLIKKGLGDLNSSLIFIPKGVAHGYANISKSKSTVIYFTNLMYNAKNPDEHSLPWDTFGKTFWEIKKT